MLEEANISGDSIDLIAFSSQFPEFTMPTQSLIAHNAIHGKEKCVTIDINANCVGMLRGLDIINRYFKDKKGEIRRALLIGSDYGSIHSKNDELLILGSYGDGACAALLEYTDDEEVGIIGSSDRTVSDEVYGGFFPECGLSHIDQYQGEKVKLSWSNPDTSISINAMRDALDDILEKHDIKTSDIDWFCGSQFAESFFNGIADKCEILKEKRIYVGDRYGYTGTSSPFFSLHTGITDGKIKHGDIVLLTTVGVGMSVCSMLVRI